MNKYKPSREQIQNSEGRKIPDLIDYNLKILFCGINPGLYSGATGYHFARPGNRFWPALHSSQFTPTLLHPSEQDKLLKLGFGITNFVERTTLDAASLSKEEILEGKVKLERKVNKYKPKVLAVLGIGSYKLGFQKPKAKIGLQNDKIGETYIWVLPNPSGLNANYTPADFTELFREMKTFANSI